MFNYNISKTVTQEGVLDIKHVSFFPTSLPETFSILINIWQVMLEIPIEVHIGFSHKVSAITMKMKHLYGCGRYRSLDLIIS